MARMSEGSICFLNFTIIPFVPISSWPKLSIDKTKRDFKYFSQMEIYNTPRFLDLDWKIFFEL